MTTHLAAYFHDERTKKGFTLGQLARMVGYRNFSKGANKISRFERQGKVTEELLSKLAETLDIDLPTVERLMEKDRQEWEMWVNEPVPMRLIVRYMAAVYGSKPLPAEITTPEEAERYACEFARDHQWNVCLAVSRKLSVWINAQGEVYARTEAKPDQPNAPYMQIGGKRFLWGFDFEQ